MAERGMETNLRRFFRLLGRSNVAKGDGRPFAHAAEDTASHVEQVRRCVVLCNLAGVEDTDPVVTNDRA